MKTQNQKTNNLENEIWKDVPNYEGYYQASNLGRIKSLERRFADKNGRYRTLKERILSLCESTKGYLIVELSKKGHQKTFRVHVLVAMAFLNHKPKGNSMVCDHINNKNTDNRLENIQIITNRENCSKDKKNGSSKYIGVSFCSTTQKWVSYISINGKNKNLGAFKTEIEASKKYQSALKNL